MNRGAADRGGSGDAIAAAVAGGLRHGLAL